MKFRVRSKDGNLLNENVFVAPNGKIYCEGLLGLEQVKGAEIELLIGFDLNLKEVFENDVLVDCYNEYRAGLDLDMGAVLIYNENGKMPFKQCGLKRLKE